MANKLSTEDFYSSTEDIEQIDIGKVFRFILMQSKLIISIIVATFILSYTNYFFSTKKYMIQSLLQFESFDQNIFDPSSSIGIASNKSASDVSSLTDLYKSRTNLLKVITDLKLNVNIEDLKKNEDIDIEILSNNQNDFTPHALIFSFSESGYSLLNDDHSKIQTSRYGEQINFNDLKITIYSSNLEKYRPLNIKFMHPESLYNLLKSQINVNANASRNSFFLNESLITVSYISHDIELGKDIINYANNIFINQRIYVETEKSRKAIDFIDQNIKSIEGVAKANKIKLKEFREKNKSIDVGLEIQAILNKISSVDEALSSIDIEITKAQEIFTTDNPAYLNLLKKKELIENQKKLVLFEIEMMPKEQQEYIDLLNDVEVSQFLFGELESRRLGFSILEASTIGDIRVVDEAYLVSMVSPRLVYVILATFISFLIACLIAIIRGYNFLPISNPAEIFDNNIHQSIIGVIPQVDDMDISNNDNLLSSSIESLIVNINSIQDNQPNKNLITITSPSPFNGKSTISTKLAEGMAKIGKKVLLIDNDLKRGKIGDNYNIKSISEKTFYAINESSIEEYMVHDNFYVIPRVKGLKNTFHFLYNYMYKDKINLFKENFDNIIFDTGPILSVADSSILVEQSDINLLVVRHGVNRINEIKQTIDNFKQINNNVDGIIYNGYAKPLSYYGYYGIYGNYSYQYYAEKYLDDTYKYEKKD